MNNARISKIFSEIADFLETEEVDFKPRAYRRAGRNIRDLEVDVSRIYEEKGTEGLEQIPGVGKSIAEKIKEYLESGKIEYYEKLKNEKPFNVAEMVRVEGLGPKRARVLYEELGVSNLEELEKAAKKGKIAPLPGFGEKTQQNIIQGLEFLKGSKGRFLLGEILPESRRIKREIDSLKEVRRISGVGSVRRRKASIGDVDILVGVEKVEDQKAVERIMERFVNLAGVVKVWSRGSTRSSIRLDQGFDVDLRVVGLESFGAALQYFTGSKDHNIVVRGIAKKKGMKLNEYGLFKGEKKIAGETEKEIYKALGMDIPAPEIRENEGEIEKALQHDLPQLVEEGDVRGDLHIHSDWDGGVHSIKEMAEMGQRMEYEYIAISDHTKFLKIENGLNERQLKEQRREIRELDLKIPLLQGAETNILKDGSLDIEDKALSQLEFVIAGVHSHLGMNKKEMTERMIRAIKNPHVNIISHPTGRLLKKREEMNLDFEAVLRAARRYRVALEINSSPLRLDLCPKKIRMAKEAGVKMAINTDSHHRGHMLYMELGVAQARRGWAEKEDIINAWPLEELLDFFEK